MSEVKRPALSLNANRSDSAPARNCGKTVRLHLALPESNEDTYPEFNYKEELAAAKKKDKIKCQPSSQTNGLDPFNEDDDDVRRIAQEMEAKYGVCGPKKRRKGRRDDYADIGMGYDESDSFIDNTDGYDEMIPQNVTTVLGGFYINSGELEFKAVDEASSEVSSSSSSGDEDEDVPKVNGTKRLLSSDSEGEKDENDEPVEKKIKLQMNGLKKKPPSPEKLKEIEKRKEEKKKLSVNKDSLKEKKIESHSSNNVREEKVTEKDESKDSMKENKKPAVPSDNISDIIESVVKSLDESLVKQKTGQLSSLEVKSSTERRTPSELDEGESNSQDGIISLENVVKLPENLPSEVVEIVDKLKELACNSTDGKRKFFTGPVNDYLLRLERSCKCLGKQTRLKIFEHLAPFLHVKKETLIKRVKNLLTEEFDDPSVRQQTNLEVKPGSERITQVEIEEVENTSQDGIISLENVVKLPENLPNEIVEIVDKLKKLVNNPTDGKVKFLNGAVNDYLLKLERSCKCLGKQSRLKIYEHLAPHLNVKKDKLIKRGKTLMYEDEMKKLKSLLDNLKSNISTTMPGLLQNYERDCQKVLQKKFSRESLTNEENKQLRMPKRKFSWTEDLRQLVKDIAGLRKKCFLLEGKSKDNLEVLMVNYLKTDLQPLWPEGWMSMTVLTKICSNVFTQNTKNQANMGNNLNTNEILPSKEIQMLSANSNLSITPILSNVTTKVNENIIMSVNKNDITINKIENSKISPKNDEIKCSTPSLTITPTNTPTITSIIPTNKSSTKPIITSSNIPSNLSSITPNIPSITPNIPSITPSNKSSITSSNISTNIPSNKSSITSSNIPPNKSSITSSNISSNLPSNISSNLQSNIPSISPSNIPSITPSTSTNTIPTKTSNKLDKAAKEVEKELKNLEDFIIIDDATPTKPKIEMILDFGKKEKKDEQLANKKSENCQIIDLTDQIERQKNLQKPKSKKFYETNVKEEFKHAILEDFPQNLSNKHSQLKNEMIKHEFTRPKSAEGDDIQKVMEDLKVLQKMSSPVKANESLTSSPVSVIAYNKSYSPKSVLNQGTSSLRTEFKTEYSPGYQDVFQRQLYNDFSLLGNPNCSTPTSSKGHYNSDKYVHGTTSGFVNDKYYQGSNNNYPQNSNKLKNLPQQSGHLPKQK